MLMEYVDITNSGTYDFLYLRIDFQNKCKYVSTSLCGRSRGMQGVDFSVGYAFINFIDPLSIIPFAKARVGTKWYPLPLPPLRLLGLLRCFDAPRWDVC
jgi:hypothetical protein